MTNKNEDVLKDILLAFVKDNPRDIKNIINNIEINLELIPFHLYYNEEINYQNIFLSEILHYYNPEIYNLIFIGDNGDEFFKLLNELYDIVISKSKRFLLLIRGKDKKNIITDHKKNPIIETSISNLEKIQNILKKQNIFISSDNGIDFTIETNNNLKLLELINKIYRSELINSFSTYHLIKNINSENYVTSLMFHDIKYKNKIENFIKINTYRLYEEFIEKFLVFNLLFDKKYNKNYLKKYSQLIINNLKNYKSENFEEFNLIDKFIYKISTIPFHISNKIIEKKKLQSEGHLREYIFNKFKNKKEFFEIIENLREVFKDKDYEYLKYKFSGQKIKDFNSNQSTISKKILNKSFKIMEVDSSIDLIQMNLYLLTSFLKEPIKINIYRASLLREDFFKENNETLISSIKNKLAKFYNDDSKSDKTLIKLNKNAPKWLRLFNSTITEFYKVTNLEKIKDIKNYFNQLLNHPLNKKTYLSEEDLTIKLKTYQEMMNDKFHLKEISRVSIGEYAELWIKYLDIINKFYIEVEETPIV
ncbi:MAG: hypothetical protein N4A44_04470 [Alphaproteobacteria bacterium]|jgi:hypothetical protein|nr:hypothetical protein [Alphaproteobacteria bacterium]